MLDFSVFVAVAEVEATGLEVEEIAGGVGFAVGSSAGHVGFDVVHAVFGCSHVAGADFEAAAISAAILMEEKAVKLYGERAAASGVEEEKALYQWLSDWEKGHLAFLADLDREIKAAIWDDNQFWPF